MSMNGEYVLVRGTDCGVHAGILVKHKGRTARLAQSRRLWYWKPAVGASWLSGVAMEGLHPSSKVGQPQTEILLLGICEIAPCSVKAMRSIQKHPEYQGQ